MRGNPTYLGLLDEIRTLHLVKSSGYGTSDDPFANFAAVSQSSGDPRYRYPVQRVAEKASRFFSLLDQGRVDELEEELTDMASLCLCAAAMLREDAP